MTVQFDPYHKWLGIPAEEQPPDHYRLLGITRFEADPDVIDAAFYRQTAHVRTYQLGPHSDPSQKLLNEIAGARACLIDPGKKAAYDAKLRATMAPLIAEAATSPVTTELDPLHPPEPPVVTHKEPLATNRTIPWPTSHRGTTGRQQTTKSPFTELLKVILGGVAGLVVGYCALLFVFRIDMLDRLFGPQATKSQRTSERPAIQQSDSQTEHTGTEATPTAPAARRPPKPIDEPAAQGKPVKLRTDETPRLAIALLDAEQAKRHQTAWAQHLGVAVKFKNSIGMEFVLIPPGEFDMGSTDEDVAALLEEAEATSQPDWYIERVPDEAPKHRVRITKPFYLGVYEVTQGEYEQVMGYNPSHFTGNPKLPVETVTWDETIAFCQKLGELEQEHSARAQYRLPTEAEWEYACRAGTTTKWSSGDDEGRLKNIAWYNNNAAEQTHPVGQKQPNGWGLYDMHGNVFERCRDWRGERYYTKSPLDDPTGEAEGSLHVIRGGSWECSAMICRAARRGAAGPMSASSGFGFRIVRNIAIAAEPCAEDESPSLPTEDTPPQAIAPFDEITAKQYQEARTDHLKKPPPDTADHAAFHKAVAAKFPRLLEQYRRPGASVSWEDARERLFKQILDEVETITDPVHRTALLLVAARQAAELGDVARVNMVLNILDDPHVTAVDVLALKLFSFHGVELQKLDPSRRADLARNLLADIWIAYRHDDYELAQQVLEVAESSISGITGHRFIQHRIGEIRKQLGAEKKRSAEHRAAWESARTLLDDSGEPQSAEGHFQLAMYLLNVKGDWQQSLAHLTECGDSQLADAAARDIAGSFNPAEMLATAKAWIDAERMPAHLRNGRAAFWLRTARSHNLIGQIGKDVDTAWDVLGERLSDRDRGAEDGWIWLEESGWQELDSAGRPTRPLAIAPFDEKTAGQHRVAWAQHLGVRPTETNSIGMRFVFIPPGEFLMGSPTSDNDAKSDELPQHPVRITKPFYLGLYEVTQGEYQQIMGDNPSHFKGDSRSPVERVSWEDAMEFCRRLSALSQEQAAGRIYRLPTEAEWEYACRAGTTTIYSFGDSAESLGDYAWYSGNSIRKTHPAGQKQPNAWGLYDMHGNVWEWCTDRWDAADYAHSALNDSIGPDGGSARVYRGGAWSSDARGCWSAYRGGALPSYRGDDLGFRLARCSVK